MEERLRQLIALGRDHYQAGEFDEAETYLIQAAADHCRFADVYNMLGVIHHRASRFPEARAAFEEALRINPAYTEAALNLSVTCNDLGDYGEARRVYQDALVRSHGEARALDPFARGKLANMHAELGAAYNGLGLFAEAIREYRHALELGPTFVDIRTRLANVYRDAGETALAAAELETVRKTHSGYVPARLSLGLVYQSLGRREDAQKEWDAVLAVDPANRAARAYLRMTRDELATGAAPAVVAAPPPVAPEAAPTEVDAASDSVQSILASLDRGRE